MKKSILYISLIAMVLLAGCSNRALKANHSEQTSQGNQTSTATSNDTVDISQFSIKKITDKDSLPIAVSSIKKVLMSTGQFSKNDVKGDTGSLQVRDVSLRLGKEQEDGSYTASFNYQEMRSPKDSTKLVSYTFTKSDMQAEESDNIKWGFKTFLQLFDVELTDDMWNNIVTVSAMNSDANGLGTDYWGYGDEKKGIQLIYANLGENVQIDIHPYHEYRGEKPAAVESVQSLY